MKNLTTALLFSLLVIGCKKNGNEQPNDNTQANSAKLQFTWKYVSITSDKPYDWSGNGTPTTNLLGPVLCNNPFKITFKTGGEGVVNAGCNGERLIQWRLTNNGNTLNRNYSNEAETKEDIIQLDETTLKTTYKFQSTPQSETLTVTTVYSKL